MRKIFLISLICLISHSAMSQDNYSLQKRFQIRSGHVEYKIKGSSNGTKSIWFDDYGQKYYEEINTNDTHSLSLFDGSYYYTIDLGTKEGTKMYKDAIPDFSVLGSGLNDNEMEELGEGLLNAFGGKVEKKKETVLGRSCDVTQVMGAKVHNYNGVVLRSYAKVFSIEEVEEAVTFEENIRVPASRFSPPSGINYSVVDPEDYQGTDEYEEYEEDEEEQGLFYPDGFSFETYKAESERIRRALGYTFAMHDASGGQYSSMWTKGMGEMIAVSAFSLRNHTNWEKDYESEGLEIFTSKGNKMAYLSTEQIDEETGKAVAGSALFIELKRKDAFIQIFCAPQKSKSELIDIFNQFNL